MKNINAVLFDMDGLLLDTERIALATFVEACRVHHFEPDVAVYLKCIGTKDTRTREILLEGYGKEFPFQPVYDLWRRKYSEETSTKPIPLKAGALDLLHRLEEEGLKRAVVTSTRQESALQKLSHTEVLGFFDFVIGGDQVLNGKPDPEIYLTACGKLGEEPGMCLALEDSDNGVLSATRAGLTVIQVPDLKEPSGEVKALGHKIVRSLADVLELIRTTKYY